MAEQTGRPAFWRTTLDELEQQINTVKKGIATIAGSSAGGRPIYQVTYGEKEDFRRQANYSSACGAGNPNYYADKSNGAKPVLYILGGVHGGELEGVAAVLNLIRVLETGEDFRGQRWDYLHRNQGRFRIILIPCANPDGRARVPVDTMVGQSYEMFRRYVQGTWKDGSLCDWPGCKSVHPIKEHVEFLGGYFNDDGVNIVHDRFYDPMAKETKLLLRIAELEAADFSLHLHGGDNCINQILKTAYMNRTVREGQNRFNRMVREACELRGLEYYVNETESRPEDGDRPAAFCIDSAMHHVCGGISCTYETNMGLDYGRLRCTHDEILDHHMILFDTLFRFYDSAGQKAT
ncbi:M14 family zinc carboxypeptidase [Paenibacillus sp. PAMC21692]|uniref:M14 family zinc carboxypeptidase n=1 Tax=Paenibacillus sp. PAMC21692 TaxID=2762320 RepID=UPI00164EDA2D|nr:M14 family zinc carboxypeptidase [Paenibacillus sp. PAMC21692]QNK59315.1 hypothetical protein H7F31_10780 [Paenibacillus sp. PAMC21692]